MSCWYSCLGCLRGELPSLKKVISLKDVEQGRRWVKEIKTTGATVGLLDAITSAVETGNVNVVMDTGMTPLHLAVAEKKHDLVRELMQAGADSELVGSGGTSPSEMARTTGDFNSSLIMKKENDKKRISSFNKELDFVARLPLFAALAPSEFPKLAAAFTNQTYQPGEVVINQGDIGDTFCVIQSGRASVTVQLPASETAEKVAELKAGDYFGEMALLHDQPRNATVEALDELQLHVLSRSHFDQLELRKKLHFKKRLAVGGAEDSNTVAESAPVAFVQKTKLDEDLIKTALLTNKNLGPLLSHLRPIDVQAIVDKAHPITVEAGEEVLTQGDMIADNFYVVAEGKFLIFKDLCNLGSVGPSGSFGELALLYQTPRAATVRAASKARLWVVNRQTLKQACRAQLQQKIDEYAKVLAGVPLFKDVAADHRALLADALVLTTYYHSEYIIRQGEQGDFFFVLYKGCVVVEKNGKDISELSSEGSKELPYFGEKALLEEESRAASIRVKSETATVLALNRAVFLQALGKSQKDQNDRKKSTWVTYRLSELQHIGLLGCGGFGSVSLVKCKMTNNFFALKCLSKGHLMNTQQGAKVMIEKSILNMTRSPFLIRCAATFNEKTHLYFLLEPAMGGELWTLMRRHNFTGSDLHARFYSACVLRGLAYLHQQFIIYRDLKTENLLLDNRGYCKITDFGLAKFVIGHTYTTCGTPDYFAPELVAATGHTFALDWWTFGVLIFELMRGEAPFTANQPVVIFQKVKRGIEAVQFRSRAPWTNLVKALCKQRPSDRLPMRPGGIKNVEIEEWYTKANFDWVSLDRRTMEPPFKPTVRNAADVSNFDANSEDIPPEPKYKDPGTGWDVGFEDAHGPISFD